MADYSRARTSMETLLAFAISQLQAQSNLDVRTVYTTDIRDIWGYLDDIQPDIKPVAAVSISEVVRKKEPQSIYVLYVFVIAKDLGSLDFTLAANQSALEKVYSALDYQVYPVDSSSLPLGSQTVFRADKDAQTMTTYMGDPGDKNMIFKCTFYIEDH